MFSNSLAEWVGRAERREEKYFWRNFGIIGSWGLNPRCMESWTLSLRFQNFKSLQGMENPNSRGVFKWLCMCSEWSFTDLPKHRRKSRKLPLISGSYPLPAALWPDWLFGAYGLFPDFREVVFFVVIFMKGNRAFFKECKNSVGTSHPQLHTW